MKIYDIAVIGSGISGLFFCLRACKKNPSIRIALITKSVLMETNTAYAQGGFCCVSDFEKDSFKKHIEDTLIAGDGLCNEDVVEFVVKESPQRVQDLTNFGVKWDKNNDGEISLSREGGHSEKRIIHHKDFTGRHIQTVLIEALKSYPLIDIFENSWVTDLLVTPEKICYGMKMLSPDEEQSHVMAKQIIIASGGAGQAYNRTTNSSIATGDGIVMAYRVGAEVSDMQFIQFHPTSFYPKIKDQVFLISEAVRGEGAIFRNHQGEDFMKKYDSRGSLAPRDIVSQAMHSEFEKIDEDYLFLDCTQIDLEIFKSKFPDIYRICSESGYPPDKKWLPITSAAHYTCGGIQVNHYGETSITNLYAIGECSHTGLHGGNRLASNSLLEGVIFAERAVKRCLEKSVEMVQIKYPESLSDRKKFEDHELLKEFKLQSQLLMSKYAGVIRNRDGLKEALKELAKIKNKVDKLLEGYNKNRALVELDFLISISLLILEHSIKYPENKGGFYNRDLA